MASFNDWYKNQLSCLNNEEHRLETLQEIYNSLQNIPRSEFSQTVSSLPLPPVFDCLNDSNSESVDVVCEILTFCMSNLTVGETTNKYGIFLEKSLTHPFPKVKIMALNEILRNTSEPKILGELAKRQSLVINIVKNVGDTDLTVVKKATRILNIMGVISLNTIIDVNVLNALKEVMSVSEIIRFRVYELFVGIAVENEIVFEGVRSTGLLDEIVEEIDNEDILLKLNVLELLSSLGTCKHGYKFLESMNIFPKLILILESCEPAIQLCEPGILKFFGNIAFWKPLEFLEKYPIVLQRLYSNLEGNDFTVIGVSLDVLGHIGSTNEGKIVLNSTISDDAIKLISNILISAPTELKIRGLNCFENFFHSIELNNQIAAITHRWFLLIDDPVRFFWNFAKNPFFEIKLAGLGVFQALAVQTWGQKAIQSTPGLLEFFLDRNEHNKEVKEAKFEIIQSLSLASDLFNESYQEKLQDFVKQGPFYVKAVTEVAIE